MVAASKSEFKHLSVMTMKTPSGNMYQLRLSAQWGRKTIGLGSDRFFALNLALEVDESIEECRTKGKDVEIDSLKELVKSRRETTPPRVLKIVEKDDLAILWDNYVTFHRSKGAWEETYVLTHIKTVGSLVGKCPYQKLENKQEIVRWLFDDPKRSPATSKNRLKLIVAAIDWASKQGQISRHWGIEYRDLLESISIKTCQSPNDEDESNIEIFSVKEVYQILEALKTDCFSRFKGKHHQYYKYVYFCWLTGCRPSEAIALKWENVDLSKNNIKFCEGRVNASGQIIEKKGTKTAPSRLFPINEELRNLLESIPKNQGYVFRNAMGKPISQQAFNGVWRTLLNRAGIPYRMPYQLRHTMISYHANNDFPIQKLCQLVGNSEKVLRERYLKLDIERIGLPGVVKSWEVSL
nr:site-specific integrase [Oscillatoria laete-virens]